MGKRTLLDGKKVLVVGLSRSGEAAALLALKQGAMVSVTESGRSPELRRKAAKLRRRGAEVELGGHNGEFFSGTELVITSPGVKDTARPIAWAKKNAVSLVSEIEFASWFCSAPLIAITGTNGKTTVTSLLGRIFRGYKNAGLVAGNIGNPFSREVLKNNLKGKTVILEVSSFQLQHIKSFRPKVSVLLNFSRNHLDHHASLREYFLAKANILVNQKSADYAVLNYDDSRIRALAAKTKARVLFFSLKTKPRPGKSQKIFGACWLEKGKIICELHRRRREILDVSGLRLAGRHNIANVMACILAAGCLRAADDAKLKKIITSFTGLEHRCEPVRRIGGIKFFNDSKSTTVDSALKALNMFGAREVLLIAGGRDKGSDFGALKKEAGKKVKVLVAVGEAKDKLYRELSGTVKVKKVSGFREAVWLAYKLAVPGDSVLLSPMCASFDMFDDFEHRGHVFKQIVNKLKEK